MRHIIKIKQCYLIHIIENKKKFEIRKNDRDYQVGDLIRFLPLEDEDYNVYEIQTPILDYKIMYLHSGYGMEEGYVALGIEEIN